MSKKVPVGKDNLLTDDEINELIKQRELPLEILVCMASGVRRPWADHEYPPYGMPGKPTYAVALGHVTKAYKEYLARRGNNV